MWKRWLAMPSVQIVLCTAVFLALTWRLGPQGIVIASPLLGALVARPLINLAADLRHGARSAQLLPLHGTHFVFRGVTVNVFEDEDHCRWVRLGDARKVFAVAASDRVLGVSYPDRVKAFGNAKDAYMRDDALIEHLSKETDGVALRFRTWIERTVALPAFRRRKQLGIRPEPPYAIF